MRDRGADVGSPFRAAVVDTGFGHPSAEGKWDWEESERAARMRNRKVDVERCPDTEGIHGVRERSESREFVPGDDVRGVN